MKKAIYFTIGMILCLWVLWGCGKDAAQNNPQEKFCRVMCLKDDGMILWIENLEYVYVEHVDTDLEIEPLDTVVMEFSEADLRSVNERFTDTFGTERSYTYRLASPLGIRYPTEEEPTFG